MHGVKRTWSVAIRQVLKLLLTAGRWAYRVRISADSRTTYLTTSLKKVGNREFPGNGDSRKSLQEPMPSHFFRGPQKKIGKFSGKVNFFQGKINFFQTNPEKVDQSFQKWLFISRREFPTK